MVAPAESSLNAEIAFEFTGRVRFALAWCGAAPRRTITGRHRSRARVKFCADALQLIVLYEIDGLAYEVL
jgi:hypothetical protein